MHEYDFIPKIPTAARSILNNGFELNLVLTSKCSFRQPFRLSNRFFNLKSFNTDSIIAVFSFRVTYIEFSKILN